MTQLKGVHHLLVQSEIRNHRIQADTNVVNVGPDEAR